MRHTPLSSGAKVVDIPQKRTKLISKRVFPASLIQIRKRRVNVAAEVFGHHQDGSTQENRTGVLTTAESVPTAQGSG